MNIEPRVRLFRRKLDPFQAIRVEEPLEEVAEWCRGEIATHNGDRIGVDIHNLPYRGRTTTVLVGRWVIKLADGLLDSMPNEHIEQCYEEIR